MNSKFPLSLLLLAACALPAWSQTTPWYIGGSLGLSQTSDDLVANRESTITSLLEAQSAFDDRDRAFKVTGGYRFLSWLAVEVDYTDLGKHTLVSNLFGGDPPAAAQLILERRVRGFGADAVFLAPVLPSWKVFGRVGAFRAELEASQSLGGNIVFTNGDPSERTGNR